MTEQELREMREICQASDKCERCIHSDVCDYWEESVDMKCEIPRNWTDEDIKELAEEE